MTMAEWFLWLKVIHIFSVVAWMAGLFYLPRLFVYHRDTSPGGEASELFKVMERRLMAAIMRPAAAVSLLSGALLFIAGGFEFLQAWVIGKLGAVILPVTNGRGMPGFSASSTRFQPCCWSLSLCLS
jgi:putative membrane protein